MLFRLATDSEIAPHATREDEEQFPVMLYVTHMGMMSSKRQVYGFRFIFARQPVSTARAMTDLRAWLAQEAGLRPEDVIILSIHTLDEEITLDEEVTH